MTRGAPWAMIVGGGGLDPAVLDAIDAEAQAQGVEAASPDALMQLGAAGTAVHELVGGAAGAAIREYGALLFHVLRFRRAGGPVYEIEPDLLRALTGLHEPVGAWRLDAPAPAGYARLPERLLWARVEPDAVPEPVDGFFWSMAEDGEGRRLDLLACLGMWPGRPGFSVAPAAAHTPHEGHWADADARGDGADFANILPGGELDGLLALTTPLEMLKLASRFFHHVATRPGTVAAVEGEVLRVRIEPRDG